MRFNTKYVLDFASEVRPFNKFLTLMVGAGDLIHNGIPNVQMFDSDIFFCNAWDDHGSLQANIDWLEQNNSTKLICVVDYYKEDQRRRFIDTFKGLFRFIDGHGGHVPHFTVRELEELLAEDGEAVNIHEKSETMLPLNSAMYFLKDGQFPYSQSYLTGRIYGGSLEGLELLFIAKIQQIYRTARQITIQPDILENLTLLSLADLQQIACCLLYDREMPLNMKGNICMNMRSWRDCSQLEIVMKKVPVDFFDGSFVSESTARADYIIEAIKRDMASGDILGQFAKYRTLKKLSKNLKLNDPI